MKNKKVKILATDDSFAHRKKGETVYESAKISSKYILEALK